MIEIQDAAGNVVSTDSTTQVTVALSSSDGATLGGSLTAKAAVGVVTFTDLSLAGTVGTAYSLAFSAEGLTAVAVSQAITLVDAGIRPTLLLPVRPNLSMARFLSRLRSRN